MALELTPAQVQEIRGWPLARREALVAAAQVSQELGGYSFDEALARAYRGLSEVAALARELFGNSADHKTTH